MSLKLRGNGFMYILFFLLWVLFNGQVTLEIVLFGIVIAGAVYAFCCKFLDYSPGKDWMILKKSGYILAYLGVLIWEIIKANAATLKLIVSPHTRVPVSYTQDVYKRQGESVWAWRSFPILMRVFILRMVIQSPQERRRKSWRQGSGCTASFPWKQRNSLIS